MATREPTKPEVAVVTETAGRQKHSQALAHLPNINPIPVLKCDAEGRVLFLNSAAESFLLSLGLSREDATRILPPNYRQQIRTILEKKVGPLASLHEYEDRSVAVTFSADPHRPECMVLVEDGRTSGGRKKGSAATRPSWSRRTASSGRRRLSWPDRKKWQAREA